MYSAETVAKSRGIRLEESQALLKVLDWMEKGLIVDHSEDTLDHYVSPMAVDKLNAIVKYFDMNTGLGGVSSDFRPENQRNACGTIGCIGGWMGTIIYADEVPEDELAVTADRYVARTFNGDGRSHHSPSLHPLFYPDSELMEQFTVSDAIKAIHNWIATGNPRWDEIRPDLCNVEDDFEEELF